MKKRKVFEVALSLFLAICLWTYVITVVTPEDDMEIKDVPIIFASEQEMRTERGLLISDQTASFVSVKFHGSRADLKRLERYKNDITAVVDTKTFTAEREYLSGYEITLPTALQDRPIEIIDRSPKTVRFTVEKLVTKKVPVRGVFDGTFATGFEAGNLAFDLDSVTVTGPAAVVEHVQYVQAILDGDKVSETFSEPVALVPVNENGEKIRSSSMELSEEETVATLMVVTEKEVPLTIEVVPGGGATVENSTVTLSTQTVVLRGEKSTLDAITELSVGELLLGSVAQDEEIVYEVTAPERTEIVTKIDEVTVSVTFTGLETRSATVSEFITTHVDKNTDDRLEARVLTQSLEIVLRGPAEALAALKDEELVAAADLTNYTTTGEFTVPVTIRTPDETVGAVGEYSVEIVLYTEG